MNTIKPMKNMNTKKTVKTMQTVNTMKTTKAMCFGEIMMRLNPKGFNRFVQANEFDVSYAGGEANVAVSLANYGVDSHFLTKVPNNELGISAINNVRKYGVNTSSVVFGGERLGIYFLEKGASQRASKVIYDRKDSAISLASVNDFDFDAIFSNNSFNWFHWTGITPALSDNCVEIIKKALEACKKYGIKVSCDLNYRKKLWSTQKANEVMSELMPFTNVCIANEEDAKDVFGIEAKDSSVEKGSLSKDGYKEIALKLSKKFGFEKVAISLRGSISASDNNWSGMLYDSATKTADFAPNYLIRIVDRVGGGDSFAGGLIYSLLNNKTNKESIDFAVAASCLKHTIEQDFNLVSVQEVNALAAGNTTGRVQR